jgi:hypothetical protein
MDKYILRCSSQQMNLNGEYDTSIPVSEDDEKMNDIQRVQSSCPNPIKWSWEIVYDKNVLGLWNFVLKRPHGPRLPCRTMYPLFGVSY